MASPTGNVLDQGFSSLSKAGNGDRTAEQRGQLCAVARAAFQHSSPRCSGDV